MYDRYTITYPQIGRSEDKKRVHKRKNKLLMILDTTQ